MTLETIIDALCTTGRDAILKRYAPDCCIASTRIALQVLAYFSFIGQPVPCRVRVWTRPLFERLHAGTFDGKLRQGEYGLMCGAPTGTHHKFHGHLVVRVQDWLIDLSAGQFSRPQRGLVVEAFSTRIEQMPAFISGPNWIVNYTPIADDSWRDAPDWTNTGLQRPIVEKILAALEGREPRASDAITHPEIYAGDLGADNL